MRRSERKDMLGYRPARKAPGPVRAPRATPRPAPGARKSNRRRVAPVVRLNRRLRGMRNWLFAILLAECLWLAGTSPVLIVRHVRVEGATIRNPREIARVAGLLQPVNIFRAHASRAARNLLKLPEVASAVVHRRYPNTLDVVVTERRPLGSVQLPAGTWLVDATGIAYLHAPKPLATHPILTAPVKDPVVLGKPVPLPALGAALRCLTLIPTLPLKEPVHLHVTDAGEAWLDGPDALKIRLGPLDDAPARLQLTARLLNGPDGSQVLKKAAVLDMTMPKNENYVPRQNTPDFRITETR
ncbi:MAG TPA: FtsQ-type POTRA domain-containing protein [Armatimonadota bacterium]|jgi:cell division protein FtsQ